MATLFDDASLVMIPSGYKDDKLYSIKPTSGDGDFTFSRDGSGASPATRVNSAGLIEKGRTNLLLQSNQFDTTWTNTSTTETSGQSGYNGTNNAWLLSKSAAFGRINQSISLSGVHTFSVYAKEGTSGWMRLVVIGTANPSAYFNLSNGEVGTTANIIKSNSENIGNGWYRYSISLNQASISEVRIYPAEADNDIGATSGNIYIQDAQLEKGLVATSYIETTTAAASAGILGDMPRLDYSGGATCPSLLLEPARTNLATLSEYFEGWSHKPNVTATTNYGTSPEGLKNATRLQFNANGFLYNIDAPAQVNGTQYTLSCYAKRNDSGTQSFGFFSNGSGAVNSAMALTSEWKRFDYTYTASNVSQLGLAGSSGADVSVYGFQVESGASYPTSYVPSYGSATARAKDHFLMLLETAGITSSGQTEATLFIEFEKPNTGENVDLMRFRGTGILGRGYIYNTGIGLASDWGQGLNFTIGENTKAVWRINSLTDGEVFVNGTKSNNASGTAWSGFWTIRFNEEGGGGVLKIKQIALFNTALTDAECISLTT